MNKRAINGDSYGLKLYISEPGRESQAPQGAELANLEHEISFKPDVLNTYNYEGWAPIHHDLLVVCAAVEYADRRTKRRQSCWSRCLDVTIPVSELRFWQSAKVQERLSGTLRQLTGDNWKLHFVQSNGLWFDSRQSVLPFPKDKKSYTIAYSDGLDSRCVAGLYSTDETVRVRVAGKKERVGKYEQPFDLIPFNVKLSPSREDSFRTRGFKFAAVTAIVSHLTGAARVLVPESGQGALGPVLCPLYNIYPDYRNHPVFFRKMELFIEALIGHHVVYEQPRLWYTKGQTIAAYIQHSNASEDGLRNTRSCWQQRHNVQASGKRLQCGLCAACLLRRMSMHAAKISEHGAYAIERLDAYEYEKALPVDSSYHPTKSMIEHGIAGVRHLQQLADMSRLSNSELLAHAFNIAQHTHQTEEETIAKLKNLAIQHAQEWDNFINSLGERSFIKRWTLGGYHGRS